MLKSSWPLLSIIFWHAEYANPKRALKTGTIGIFKVIVSSFDFFAVEPITPTIQIEASRLRILLLRNVKSVQQAVYTWLQAHFSSRAPKIAKSSSNIGQRLLQKVCVYDLYGAYNCCLVRQV